MKKFSYHLKIEVFYQMLKAKGATFVEFVEFTLSFKRLYNIMSF